MMRFRLALMLAIALAGAKHALASTSWDDYSQFTHLCQLGKLRQEAKCLAEIQRMLENDIIWGGTGAAYNDGQKQWGKTKLRLDFGAKPGDEGDFRIVSSGGKLAPKISLAKKSDPFELLITINHEIVHFANSMGLKAAFDDKKKLSGCITAYEKTMLDNEKLAYLGEIYFWKSAPEWFKNEMKRYHFNSRLLGADKIRYIDYYSQLEKELVADGDFVAKRYIDLGKFPKCARALLDAK